MGTSEGECKEGSVPGESWYLLRPEQKPMWLELMTHPEGLREEAGKVAAGKTTEGLDGYPRAWLLVPGQ